MQRRTDWFLPFSITRAGRWRWLAAGVALGCGIGVGSMLVREQMQVAPVADLPATATPTPTSTPTATPTVAPSPTSAALPDFPRFTDLLLSDPLNAAASSSLQVGGDNTATYQFANGAYQIQISEPAYVAWSTAEGVYDDAAVEVNLVFPRATPIAAAGIMFRYQDRSNYYLFSVSSDRRYSLDVQTNGTWTSVIDWTRALTINEAGTSNTLRVEAAGQRIRLYINNKLLDEVADSTFTSGKVALVLNTFDEGGAQAAFDSLTIRGREQ